MAFFPGRASTLTVASTAKPIDTVEFTINGELADVTNFTSAGWQENELGIKSVKITCSGPYNSIGSGASQSDFVGASATVAFDLDGGGATASLSITGRVSDFKVTTDVRGVARANYVIDSTGAPTLTY
jgi:hypothetical protein